MMNITRHFIPATYRAFITKDLFRESGNSMNGIATKNQSVDLFTRVIKSISGYGKISTYCGTKSSASCIAFKSASKKYFSTKFALEFNLKFALSSFSKTFARAISHFAGLIRLVINYRATFCALFLSRTFSRFSCTFLRTEFLSEMFTFIKFLAAVSTFRHIFNNFFSEIKVTFFGTKFMVTMRRRYAEIFSAILTFQFNLCIGTHSGIILHLRQNCKE